MAATDTEQNVDEQISEEMGFEIGDSPFSMELSQDQKDIRDWVHGFAEDVVRPAASEWDEREEYPWPIDPGGRQDRPLRLRGHRPVLGRPERPLDADRQRGAVLGRRRHRHVDLGHHARRRRDLLLGHARADGRVGPAVLRHPGRAQGRGVLRLRARRRLRRLGATAPPPSTTRPRTSGSSTARRPGRPTAASPTSTS